MSMMGYGRGGAGSRAFRKGTIEYKAAELALQQEMEEEKRKRKQKNAYDRSQKIVNKMGASSPFKRTFDVE